MNDFTTLVQMTLAFTVIVVPIVAFLRYAGGEVYDPTPPWPQGVQEEDLLPWDIRRLTPSQADAEPATPAAEPARRTAAAPTLP